MPDAGVIRRLILADGTILDDCDCGYSEKQLWCFLRNLTLVEAFQIFSNPQKVSTVTFEYGADPEIVKTTYIGFSNIKSINCREETVDVCLIGENTSIVEGDDRQ